MTGGFVERALEEADLERMRAELAGIAAELVARRVRLLDARRRLEAGEVEAALGAYRGLYDRIAAVLACLLGADGPPGR